jgi:hypothetical protein
MRSHEFDSRNNRQPTTHTPFSLEARIPELHSGDPVAESGRVITFLDLDVSGILQNYFLSNYFR